MLESGETDALADLAPFLSKDTLKQLARKMLEEEDLDALEDIAPFLK